MKRRNFLKAIGLGALVAPAVVMAKAEKPQVYKVGESSTEIMGASFGAIEDQACVMHIYEKGSTVPLDIYEDEAKTIPRCNPVLINGRGEMPRIYTKVHVYTIRFENYNGVPTEVIDVLSDEKHSVIIP